MDYCYCLFTEGAFLRYRDLREPARFEDLSIHSIGNIFTIKKVKKSLDIASPGLWTSIACNVQAQLDLFSGKNISNRMYWYWKKIRTGNHVAL